MKPRLVLVTWHDPKACSPEWESLDASTFELPLVCQSAGWLIHRDRKTVIIARTINEQGETEGRYALPRGCVREIKPL